MGEVCGLEDNGTVREATEPHGRHATGRASIWVEHRVPGPTEPSGSVLETA